jgi:Electron transfer DM13
MRFRFLLVLFGALCVAATFTFPTWYPLIPQGGDTNTARFPGLPTELQASFAVLPEDLQLAYQTLAEEEPEQALSMLTARLLRGESAPSEDQLLPELVGSIITARASLAGLDALRVCEGSVVIYQAADGSYLIRFEDFTITPGPDLRVVLSVVQNPQDANDVQAGDLDYELGALRGVSGNQNYSAPPEFDLRQYRSIVIYSPSLELIYASGNLFFSAF